ERGGVSDPPVVTGVEIHRCAVTDEGADRGAQQLIALGPLIPVEASAQSVRDGVRLHDDDRVAVQATGQVGDPAGVGGGVGGATGGVAATVAVRDVVGHEHRGLLSGAGPLTQVPDLVLDPGRVAVEPGGQGLTGDLVDLIGVGGAALRPPGENLTGSGGIG